MGLLNGEGGLYPGGLQAEKTKHFEMIYNIVDQNTFFHFLKSKLFELVQCSVRVLNVKETRETRGGIISWGGGGINRCISWSTGRPIRGVGLYKHNIFTVHVKKLLGTNCMKIHVMKI